MSEVEIWCDDASHQKRVFVRAYRQQAIDWPAYARQQLDIELGDIPTRWAQINDKHSPKQPRSSTVVLTVDDDTPTPPVHDGEAWAAWRADPRPLRVRITLACRRCKSRGVEVRQDRLDSILDTLAANGIENVTLVQLAARMRRS